MYNINILGTEYNVKILDENEDKKLEIVNGYCDTTTKKIVCCKVNKDTLTKEDLNKYYNKIIRHEIIHAFIYESGLDTEVEWALDESCVDWMSIQICKIYKVFMENSLND